MKREIVSVLFSDIAGYSKLTEPQLKKYFDDILPQFSSIFTKHKDQFLELNSWGDGIFAVTKDPYLLARIALDVRDFFKKKNWEEEFLPGDFACRIALNSGVAFIGHDALREREGIVGSQINLSARIEPVTPPGEVWVTEQFAKMIDSIIDKKLAFDDQGETSLAKKYGSHRLFRLRWSDEPAQAQILSKLQTTPESSPTQSPESNISTSILPASSTSKSTTELFSEMKSAFNNNEIDTAHTKHHQLLQNPSISDLDKKQINAAYLYHRYAKANDSSALQELKSLAKDKEVASLAHSYVGSCYKKAKDYDKAAFYFESSIETSSNQEQRTEATVTLSECYHYMGKSQDALTLLMKELTTCNSSSNQVHLYLGLSWIYQQLKSPGLQAIAIEKAIEISPNDTGMRFDAAYAYSQTNFHALSQSHYLISLDFNSEDAICANNLAVQYNRLGMNISAVKWFKKSAALGNTLASANLASRYLNAGFADEADEILEKSRKQVDVHESIGQGLVSLARAKQAERDSHTEVAAKSREQRQFVQQFAGAYFVPRGPTESRFVGSWVSVDAPQIEIRATGNSDSAIGTWVHDGDEFRIDIAIMNSGGTITLFRKSQIFGEGTPQEVGYGYMYLSADNDKLIALLFERKIYAQDHEQRLRVFSRVNKLVQNKTQSP